MAETNVMAWLSLSSGSGPHAQEERSDIGDDERDSNSDGDIRLQPGPAISSSSKTDGEISKRSGRQSWEAATNSVFMSQIKSHFLPVEGSMINLLENCLKAEDNVKTAILCRYVDHYESTDDQDLGWGCGWRNIQMLCSFLVTQDAEASEILFGGAKFVPDIPALQRWLEIAWSKGFDVPGADFFDWCISGTMKWIGTAECAALLRSFGLRAKVVSFSSVPSMKGELRQPAGSAMPPDDQAVGDDDRTLSGEERRSDRGNGKNTSPIEDANNDDFRCHETEVEFLTVPQEADKRQPGDASSYSNSEARGDFKAKKDDESTEERQGVQQQDRNLVERLRDVSLEDTKFNGCGERKRTEATYPRSMASKFLSNKNSTSELREHILSGGIFIEECTSPKRKFVESKREEKEKFTRQRSGEALHSFPLEVGVQQESQKNSRVDTSKGVSKEHEGTKISSQNSEGDADHEYQKTIDQQVEVNEKQPDPQISPGVSRAKAGMQGPSRGGPYNHNHYHLVAWVWGYFTEDLPEGKRILSRHCAIKTKRSPLYFQHEGHSQTIVGIERRLSHTSRSEEVFFLVFDPSHVLAFHLPRRSFIDI